MRRLLMRLAMLPILALAFAGVAVLPVEAQQPESVIRGRLYLDMNANGTYDQGDIAAGGLQLEFANGESIQVVTTDDDGQFSINVTPGMWRGRPLPPQGISLPEDFSLEVSIPEDETTTVDLDLAIPLGIFQALLAAQPEALDLLELVIPADLDEGLQDLADPDAPEPQIYTGPMGSPESELPPQILPESGAPIAPKVTRLLAFGALFAVGAAMVAVGRRARAP